MKGRAAPGARRAGGCRLRGGFGRRRREGRTPSSASVELQSGTNRAPSAPRLTMAGLDRSRRGQGRPLGQTAPVWDQRQLPCGVASSAGDRESWRQRRPRRQLRIAVWTAPVLTCRPRFVEKRGSCLPRRPSPPRHKGVLQPPGRPAGEPTTQREKLMHSLYATGQSGLRQEARIERGASSTWDANASSTLTLAAAQRRASVAPEFISLDAIIDSPVATARQGQLERTRLLDVLSVVRKSTEFSRCAPNEGSSCMCKASATLQPAAMRASRKARTASAEPCAMCTLGPMKARQLDARDDCAAGTIH